MFNVQLLNEISPVIHELLPKEKFTTSKTVTDPNAVIVRSANMHDMTLNDNLLAIARAGAGVNNIPVELCSNKGIVVFNSPGANANAVKEMVICALLMATRNVPESIIWTKNLKGKKKKVPTATLR